MWVDEVESLVQAERRNPDPAEVSEFIGDVLTQEELAEYRTWLGKGR